MQRFNIIETDDGQSRWVSPVIPSGDIRSNVLYVYGVDYLNSRAIYDYFKLYNPSKIEWLNDSSCNVIFQDS